MRLAGIEIRDEIVLELVRALNEHGFRHTAMHLELAVDAGAPELALTVWERDQVLSALGDAPVRLLQLRATLLAENVGRRRDGLA